MKFYILSAIFAVLASLSSGSPFTDCGSTTGTVSAVEVTNCPDGSTECPLKKGTTATITIKFASKIDSKSLTAEVHGIIAGVPIPFPIPEPDACQKGVSCPVKNGGDYTYSNDLSIKRSYPPLSVTVKYELVDSDSGDMVCVKIPCKIQS